MPRTARRLERRSSRRTSPGTSGWQARCREQSRAACHRRGPGRAPAPGAMRRSATRPRRARSVPARQPSPEWSRDSPTLIIMCRSRGAPSPVGTRCCPILPCSVRARMADIDPERATRSSKVAREAPDRGHGCHPQQRNGRLHGQARLSRSIGADSGRQDAIAPGKRMLSSMSPTIIVPDGERRAVVGSPGARRSARTSADRDATHRHRTRPRSRQLHRDRPWKSQRASRR